MEVTITTVNASPAQSAWMQTTSTVVRRSAIPKAVLSDVRATLSVVFAAASVVLLAASAVLRTSLAKGVTALAVFETRSPRADAADAPLRSVRLTTDADGACSTSAIPLGFSCASASFGSW